MATTKPKKKADGPRRGRPPKPPEERVKRAVYCSTSFPPEVVAWLVSLDPAGRSRHTGMNQLIWREFRRAAAENPGIPAPPG